MNLIASGVFDEFQFKVIYRFEKKNSSNHFCITQKNQRRKSELICFETPPKIDYWSIDMPLGIYQSSINLLIHLKCLTIIESGSMTEAENLYLIMCSFTNEANGSHPNAYVCRHFGLNSLYFQVFFFFNFTDETKINIFIMYAKN